MNNVGRSQHRFADNPLEQDFAEEWELQNTDHNGNLNGMQTLDYLLAKDRNNPMGEVTDRDREVAATVVQWLGSPVGQSMLSEVLGIDIQKYRETFTDV